jgi:hypothetical protein
VLAGGEFLFRSRDGGATWDEASSNATHLDHHVIVEDPNYQSSETPNKRVYGGNDGGIFMTNDILAEPGPTPPNGPVIWISRNNSLGVTQFYGAAGHAATGVIVGGTQDNGTVRFRPANGPEGWDHMAFGDGGFCAVDQTGDPYFYGENIFLTIYRSTNGGAKAEAIWDGPNGIPKGDCSGLPCASFIAPFVIDPNPNQENTILAGGKSLWRTTHARAENLSDISWPEIKAPIAGGSYINAIAIAEGNSNLIWVGYIDGTVAYTTNGMAGPSPSPTPSWNSGDPNNVLPHGPGHPCTRVTIGPQTPDAPARTVYVTFGGFNNNNVWRRESDGITWTDISTDRLPQTPVYSLVVSPSNPDALYIGTETGVFASSDGGAHWSSGFGGPARTRVVELVWMGTGVGRKLIAVTHGRGIFTLSPPTN